LGGGSEVKKHFSDLPPPLLESRKVNKGGRRAYDGVQKKRKGDQGWKGILRSQKRRKDMKRAR